MSKEWVAAAGAVFGSLAEEGLEEVFPGLGELGYRGELGGALASVLGSELVEEEREAIKSFVKYAYRQVNETEAPEEISDEEVEAFTEKFGEIPNREKKKIINNYKNVFPYEYSLIQDFLKKA